MKKIISGITIFLGSILLLTPYFNVSAEPSSKGFNHNAFQDTQVEINISDQTVQPGDTITVPMEINVLDDELVIGGFALDIIYDSAVLQFVECEIGEGFAGACNGSADDIVQYSGVSALGKGGAFSAGTATFEVMSEADTTSGVVVTVENIFDTSGVTILDTTTRIGTITVEAPNQSPEFGTLEDRANSVGDIVNFIVVATDADGDSLTYEGSGLPDGIVINETGLISGSLTNAGTFTVTLTANDGRDGTDTASFMWTVEEVDPGQGSDDFDIYLPLIQR